MIVEPNLQEIHMTYPIFRDAVRRESITGMDISLLVLSCMFNMIIGIITEDNFWISHIMLKWNEIKISLVCLLLEPYMQQVLNWLEFIENLSLICIANLF